MKQSHWQNCPRPNCTELIADFDASIIDINTFERNLNDGKRDMGEVVQCTTQCPQKVANGEDEL